MWTVSVRRIAPSDTGCSAVEHTGRVQSQSTCRYEPTSQKASRMLAYAHHVVAKAAIDLWMCLQRQSASAPSAGAASSAPRCGRRAGRASPFARRPPPAGPPAPAARRACGNSPLGTPHAAAPPAQTADQHARGSSPRAITAPHGQPACRPAASRLAASTRGW